MVDDAPPGAGWRADPWRTYDERYFDGVKFTDQVSRGGKTATDPFFDLDAPLPVATVAAPVERVPPAPQRRSSLPWVVLAVLAVVVLAVVAVVALAAGGDDEGDEVPVDTTTIEEQPETTEEEPATTEAPTTTEEEPATTEAPSTTAAADP